MTLDELATELTGLKSRELSQREENRREVHKFLSQLEGWLKPLQGKVQGLNITPGNGRVRTHAGEEMEVEILTLTMPRGNLGLLKLVFTPTDLERPNWAVTLTREPDPSRGEVGADSEKRFFYRIVTGEWRIVSTANPRDADSKIDEPLRDSDVFEAVAEVARGR